MLWLIVLIQTLFFIAHDKHSFVILFILLSLGASYFTKNELYYLFVPAIIVHLIYLNLYNTSVESFRFKRKKMKVKRKAVSKQAKSTSKQAKKTGTKAASASKKQVKTASKQVKKVNKINPINTSKSEDDEDIPVGDIDYSGTEKLEEVKTDSSSNKETDDNLNVDTKARPSAPEKKNPDIDLDLT